MKRERLQRALLCGVLVCGTTAGAQTPAASQEVNAVPAKQSAMALPEIGGVVTSQPLTQYGQWFHAGFTQHWNVRTDVDAYQLLVKERVSPRGGSEVQIFSGESLVYRAMLPRNQLQILALSEAAVELAYQSAVEQGLQALLFQDADLSKSGL